MNKLKYLTITMPDDFRRRLDRYAKRYHVSRSGFIRIAVLKCIKKEGKIKKIDLTKIAQESFDIGVSHQLGKKLNEIISYLNNHD